MEPLACPECGSKELNITELALVERGWTQTEDFVPDREHDEEFIDEECQQFSVECDSCGYYFDMDTPEDYFG